MENKNNNCLAGMACPSCGSVGPFAIQASVIVLVGDDGILEDTSGHEWNDTSICGCDSCDHSGTVATFTVQ